MLSDPFKQTPKYIGDMHGILMGISEAPKAKPNVFLAQQRTIKRRDFGENRFYYRNERRSWSANGWGGLFSSGYKNLHVQCDTKRFRVPNKR